MKVSKNDTHDYLSAVLAGLDAVSKAADVTKELLKKLDHLITVELEHNKNNLKREVSLKFLAHPAPIKKEALKAIATGIKNISIFQQNDNKLVNQIEKTVEDKKAVKSNADDQPARAPGMKR